MLSNYCIAKFRNRNVIAFRFTKNHSVIRSALTRYRPDTTKRALFRYWLEIATLFRLPGVWEKISGDQLANMLGFNLDQWMDAVSVVFRERPLLPVLVWPPERGRGRIYVHLLRHDGYALAFSKISLTADSNHRLLIETEALKLLAKLGHKKYHAPLVLGAGMFNNHRYIVVEAIPAYAKPFRANAEQFPFEAVREYAMPIRLSSTSQIQSSDWWQRFYAMIDHNTTFFKEACDIVEEGRIKTCRVNGDLGPANMIKGDGRLWIVDWEQSCPDGPWITDAVSFYMGSNRRRILKNTNGELRNLFGLLNEFPYTASRREILMALAFLHGARFTLASKLIEVWSEND